MTMHWEDAYFDDWKDEQGRRAADPDPDRHTPAKFWSKHEPLAPTLKPEPEAEPAQPAKPYKMGIREKYAQDGYDPS